MIGLDTNILVRYLTQDDAVQYPAVLQLLTRTGERFFVPDMVLVEVDWVLTSLYAWSACEVAKAFSRLLTIVILKVNSSQIVMSHPPVVRGLRRQIGIST